MTDPDPQEPGQAWAQGDLPSSEYFAMVRRETRPWRRPKIWQRLLQRITRTRKPEAS